MTHYTYNALETLKVICKDLKRELEESYASKESIDKIFNDLVDSINRNVNFNRIDRESGT